MALLILDIDRIFTFFYMIQTIFKRCISCSVCSSSSISQWVIIKIIVLLEFQLLECSVLIQIIQWVWIKNFLIKRFWTFITNTISFIALNRFNFFWLSLYNLLIVRLMLLELLLLLDIVLVLIVVMIVLMFRSMIVSLVLLRIIVWNRIATLMIILFVRIILSIWMRLVLVSSCCLRIYCRFWIINV